MINYSERFSLTGMTGVFSKAALDGLKTVKGTDGPPTENQMAGQDAAKEDADADGLFGVAYTLQTGPTRYAPMQQQPPTKITAKVATPLFPTSSAKIATTWLPPPVALTTMTESATYVVTSRENDVRICNLNLRQHALKSLLIDPCRHHPLPILMTTWPST